MSKLNEIHNYLLARGVDEEVIVGLDKSSVYLSMEIMEYAHRNQTRENGEDYANHPSRCLQNYRKLIGLVADDPFCIDEELLAKYHIPFSGVQEVCLLHDVVEDSDFTLDDLEEIFTECGLGKFFNIYIKRALIDITHIKGMDYFLYIKKCMENPIAAIAKMMDLQDNLNVFSLNSFDEYSFKRTCGYIKYMYWINNRYNFIENAKKYKDEFASRNK